MNRSDGRLIAKLGDFLAKEHNSRIDPYLEWARNPLAVLALATVAAALCGLYLHPRALVFASGLATLLAVGIAWPWLAVRGLGGTLSFGRARAREGEPVPARLVVRNRMPWSAWGLSVRGARPGEGLVAMDVVKGWSTAEVVWDLVPDRRGEYPSPGLRIGSAFPYGVWECSRPVAVPAPLLVWPKTFPVGPIPEALGGREGDGPARRGRAGSSGDLIGVRPYRRGDPLRRVHWPQSARHGNLIVCELEAQALPRVRVVIDVDPRSHAGEGPDGSLEWAVRVAASLAEGWIGQGARVEVVHGGRVVPAGTGTVSARRARVLDALARLEPDGGSTLGEVLDGTACGRFDEGLTVVVATDQALLDLPGRPDRARGERFVVLDSAAFGGGPAHAESGGLAVRPWIWIGDPGDVPGAVLRGGKEVGFDRPR